MPNRCTIDVRGGHRGTPVVCQIDVQSDVRGGHRGTPVVCQIDVQTDVRGRHC